MTWATLAPDGKSRTLRHRSAPSGVAEAMASSSTVPASHTKRIGAPPKRTSTSGLAAAPSVSNSTASVRASADKSMRVWKIPGAKSRGGGCPLAPHGVAERPGARNALSLRSSSPLRSGAPLQESTRSQRGKSPRALASLRTSSATGGAEACNRSSNATSRSSKPTSPVGSASTLSRTARSSAACSMSVAASRTVQSALETTAES